MAHPWLARARTAVEHLANERIAVRASADAGSVLVRGHSWVIMSS